MFDWEEGGGIRMGKGLGTVSQDLYFYFTDSKFRYTSFS